MAPTFNVVDAILPKNTDATARGHFNALFQDAVFGTAMVALKIVLMAHSAWMMGDAIIRTLYRLFVSHKHMLEWRTASQAQKSGGNTLTSYYRMMYGAVIIAARRTGHPGRGRLDAGPSVAFFLRHLLGGIAGLRLADQPLRPKPRTGLTRVEIGPQGAAGRRAAAPGLYFEAH